MVRRLVLGGAIAVVATACTGGEADIGATLHDDGIALSQDAVASGDVTLEATNEGTAIHEFEVFAAPDGIDAEALTVGDDAKVADDRIELVDEVEDIAPGTSASLHLTLEAGSYVVLCNLPGHYASGMHATFTVA